LSGAIGTSEWITESLQRTADAIISRLQTGLPVLASVGATAPFVGLLGTVIGIYNALIAIGVSGQGSIEKVAGPVGEALIMTAIGLVVAVPAVLGYNVLLRRNKTVQERVSHFTHELHAYLISGVKMGLGMDKPPPSAGVKPPAAAIAR
jgi:biopolymer transport protein ExbB